MNRKASANSLLKYQWSSTSRLTTILAKYPEANKNLPTVEAAEVGEVLASGTI